MAGRHEAQPARRGPGSGALTWLRLARLQATRSVPFALVLAVASLLATLFLSISPVAQHRADDRALGDALRSAPSGVRDVTLRLPMDPLASSIGLTTDGESAKPGPSGGSPTPPFAPVDGFLRTALGPDLAGLVHDPITTATTPSLLLADRWATPLALPHQQLVVTMTSEALDRVDWTQGNAPGPPVDAHLVGSAEGIEQQTTMTVIPIALRDTTAQTYQVAVGDVLVLHPIDAVEPTVAVRIDGLFTPQDPRDPLWESDPRMLGIAKVFGPQGSVINEAAALAPPSSYGALSDVLFRMAPNDPWLDWRSPALNHTWTYRVDDRRITRDDVPLIRDALVHLESDPTTFAGLREAPTVTTGLGRLLEQYDRDLATTDSMVSFTRVGLAALSGLVLAVTGLIGLGRSRPDLSLLIARGGSRRRAVPIALATLFGPAALTTVAVLAAVALGAHMAWSTVLTAVLVLVLPMTLVTVVATGWLRVVPSRPNAVRRIVLEVGIVLLAGLAVTSLRSRAGDIAAGTLDWYAALAPPLLALAGGVVAVRLLPWGVGWLAARAARGRGLVTMLGLARASRTGPSAVLPLLAVSVGTMLVALLATLGLNAEAQRERAAYERVGADVTVEATRVDDALVSSLREVPGVTTVAAARVVPRQTVVTDAGETVMQIMGMDLADYAAVVENTPIALGERTVRLGEGSSAVPIVASDLSVGTDVRMIVEGHVVEGSIVQVDPSLHRIVDGRETPVLVLPLSALQAALPGGQPTTVFVRTGAPEAVVSRFAADPTAFGSLVTDVTSASAADAMVADRALTTYVARTHLVGALLAAGLALLALVLLLAATREDRRQVVVRLRTMGLPRGVERRLAWVEVLPVVLVAALIGAAIGLIVPTVLSSALDLRAVTGAVTHQPLEVSWLAGAAAVGTMVVLAWAALALDAAVARRAALSEDLRKGDRP